MFAEDAFDYNAWLEKHLQEQPASPEVPKWPIEDDVSRYLCLVEQPRIATPRAPTAVEPVLGIAATPIVAGYVAGSEPIGQLPCSAWPVIAPRSTDPTYEEKSGNLKCDTQKPSKRHLDAKVPRKKKPKPTVQQILDAEEARLGRAPTFFEGLAARARLMVPKKWDPELPYDVKLRGYKIRVLARTPNPERDPPDDDIDWFCR